MAINEPDSHAFRTAASEADHTGGSPVARGAAYADYLADRGYHGAADYWYRRSGAHRPTYEELAATSSPGQAPHIGDDEISPVLMTFLPGHVGMLRHLHAQAYTRLMDADHSRDRVYDEGLSESEREFHRRRSQWRWVIDSTHSILHGRFDAMRRLQEQLHMLGHPMLTDIDPEHFGSLLRAYTIASRYNAYHPQGWEDAAIRAAQKEGIPESHARDAIWMIHAHPEVAQAHGAGHLEYGTHADADSQHRYTRHRESW